MTHENSAPTAASASRSQRLRGVIFDMDGVLVDSEPWIEKAARALFAEHGREIPDSLFRSFVGMGEDLFLREVAAALHVEIDTAVAKRRLYELYLELTRGRLGPAQGAREFISRCREQGLRIAVASSADDMKVRGNLEELGLPADAFDAVVTGSQVARKKPAPDLFLEAARRLDIDPRDCLIIEDAVAGIAAAKIIGARCLGITTTFAPEDLREADWVAPNLAGAPPDVLNW